MLSPAKVESAIQKLLPTLRDGTRAEKFLDILSKSPTASEWIDDMATEIADNLDDDAEEVEGKIRAVFATGIMLGEEASRVKVD